MNTLIIGGVYSVCAMVASASHAATFSVTNTSDSGAGSLRQAINDANAAAGFDIIEFNIAGAGVRTIFPNTPLPTLLESTFVDGSTQPGFAGTPLIEIAGDLAGVGAVGLQIIDNSSQVGWLTINGFDSHGIRISGTGNASIVGCWIGLNNNGAAASFPNGGEGVFIDDSPNNDIGGITANLRNVISGNSGQGVRISGSAATGNIVKGNYIGTNADGDAALANGVTGILLIICEGNTIGGTAAGAGNVISGQSFINIGLSDCTAAGNTIQGNYIGLNAAGNALLGTPLDAINLTRSPNTLIGGAVSGARNVIAGASGINIDAVLLSDGATIQGNYIGTDSTGTVALGGGMGISIANACDITIGGNTAAERNVISGHTDDGISIIDISSGTCSLTNVIFGNYIGVAADGTSPLGNGGNGVHISRHSNNRIGNTIGGANLIAYNTLAGVLVDSDLLDGLPSTGNYISANKIHSNGGLGIDLSADLDLPDGVTLNDVGDADTGANEFQNYPTILSASADGSTLNIALDFSGTPSNPYSIEIFANDSCDPSGFGEGQRLVSIIQFATDGIGNWAQSGVVHSFPFIIWPNEFVTATITDTALANTSEFSPCFMVTSASCGTVQSGDCFTPNPTGGCYDPDCCSLVCEIEPSCCDSEWTQACADAAFTICAAPCPGDIPFVSPGVVNVTDLLFLLASWGTTGPPRPRADLAPVPSGDGQVNVTDLLALLAGWGTCP